MISKVVRFWKEPAKAQGQSLLDDIVLSEYEFYTFLIVSSAWGEVKDGGVATIAPIAPSLMSNFNINANHPVLHGGEQAAYRKAVDSLKSIPELSGLKYSEHDNI